MHGQQYLLNDVLKQELGFDGFLVSDWQGIDQIDSDYYTAVVTAINAGIDMNMVPYAYRNFIDIMTLAVSKGDISQERIDDAVYRILKVKFAMGLFERPFSNPDNFDLVGTEEHRQLAREAVAKSLVLLQNENDALPIAKDTPLIFLAGEGADDIGMQSGGWTIQWQGAVGNITPGTTIKDAIQTAASGQCSTTSLANMTISKMKMAIQPPQMWASS
jgi:beta-glucosidase